MESMIDRWEGGYVHGFIDRPINNLVEEDVDRIMVSDDRGQLAVLSFSDYSLAKSRSHTKPTPPPPMVAASVMTAQNMVVYGCEVSSF